MNPLETLQLADVTVELSSNGKLKISGTGNRDAVLQFVRDNKNAIVDALKSKLVLPASCPIMTRWFTAEVRRACAFGEEFFWECIEDGTISLKMGCPLIKCCGFTTGRCVDQPMVPPEH